MAQQAIAQPIAAGHEVVNDANIAFRFHLFNPANTSTVKAFWTYALSNSQHPGAYNIHTAGYINTTAAINAIKFVPVTGNIDAGIFKLYGISIMSTVIATSVLPDSTANDTLTIGATGDSVVIGGNLLTMNTLQDAGGNTISLCLMVLEQLHRLLILPGAMKSISTQTASSAAS